MYSFAHTNDTTKETEGYETLYHWVGPYRYVSIIR